MLRFRQIQSASRLWATVGDAQARGTLCSHVLPNSCFDVWSPRPALWPVRRVISVADVYDTHVALREEGWRPATRRLSQVACRAWFAFSNDEVDVTTLTVATLVSFRKELRRCDREPANAIRIAPRVKGMFRLAVEAGLLTSHPIAPARSRGSKSDKAKPVPEFMPEAVGRPVALFDPRFRAQWRPCAAMMPRRFLGAVRLRCYCNARGSLTSRRRAGTRGRPIRTESVADARWPSRVPACWFSASFMCGIAVKATPARCFSRPERVLVVRRDGHYI